MAEKGERRAEGARPVRFTGARKARFLEVLGQTGNQTAAAEAIGTSLRAAQARRGRDPAFAQAWNAALAAAERRLGGARHPFDGTEDGRFEVIQRARTGKLQIMTVRSGRWSAAIEDCFIAALRMGGNVAAATRLVGFSESAIWERRRKWPAFARRMEEALEDAEIALEFRVACMGNNVGAGPRHEGDAGQDGAAEEASGAGVPFDPEFALRFLKWREEKRRGGGRRGRVPREPSIDEVTEKIIRKVEAIKRHRARGGDEAGRD